MTDPIVSHCPFCGHPWPRDNKDGTWTCKAQGCLSEARAFWMSFGTIDPVAKSFWTGGPIILEVPPGSVPDTKKGLKFKSSTPQPQTNAEKEPTS